MEPEVKSARRTVDGSLTEGRTERRTAVYADEDECVHNCTAADDPEASILGPSRQTESIVWQNVRNTHGHKPKRARDTHTTNIVAVSYLETNIVGEHMKYEAAESQIDLPRGAAVYEASIDSKLMGLMCVAGRA